MPDKDDVRLSKLDAGIELEIINKDAKIVQLEDDLKTQEAVFEERLSVSQKRLTESEETIAKLQNELNAKYDKTGADEALLQANEQYALVIRAVRKEAELKTDQVVELESSLEASKRELNRANAALNDVQTLYLAAQEQKNQLESQLDTLNKKTQVAFEMSDISQYLTSVINDFNNSVNTEDATVNYIINELDVDMKASIAKTEDSKLLMAAPSLSASSPEALSTIKFSISAVPKDTDSI